MYGYTQYRVCVYLKICLMLSFFPRLDVIELSFCCNGVALFHKDFDLITKFTSFKQKQQKAMRLVLHSWKTRSPLGESGVNLSKFEQTIKQKFTF